MKTTDFLIGVAVLIACTLLFSITATSKADLNGEGEDYFDL